MAKRFFRPPEPGAAPPPTPAPPPGPRRRGRPPKPRPPEPPPPNRAKAGTVTVPDDPDLLDPPEGPRPLPPPKPGAFTARGQDSLTGMVIPGLQAGTDAPSPRERLLIALRDSGMSYRQIADTLNLTSASNLRTDISKARKKVGVLAHAYEIACARLDTEIVPVAVERLAGMVNAGVPEAVFRTLTGRGVLREKSSGEATPSAPPTLNVQFVMPGGVATGQMPLVAAGSIVGTPRGLPAAPAEAPAPAAPQPVSVPTGASSNV